MLLRRWNSSGRTLQSRSVDNRAFYRQVLPEASQHHVIPLALCLARALSDWLGTSAAPGTTLPLPLAGRGRGGGQQRDEGQQQTLTFHLDLDAIEALAPEREALWARLEKTSFLTSDEKRSLIGYDAALSPTVSKSNPNHDDRGRFDFAPDGNQRVAAGPRGGPPKAPPPPPKPQPTPPKADPGTTPGGRPLSKHGRDQATELNFSDQKIDAIVENNAKTRVGKIDSSGQKTWEYTDARGNTVVTNESGGIVTVFSTAPKGIYIERP